MSLINNIPFDINRTAVEKNATVKRKGTVPVYHADAIKPLNRRDSLSERRRGSRRKIQARFAANKRHLIERREQPRTDVSNDPIADAHTSGHIIDVEV